MIGDIKIIASTENVKYTFGESNCWSFKDVSLSVDGLNNDCTLLSLNYSYKPSTILNIKYGKTTGFE